MSQGASSVILVLLFVALASMWGAIIFTAGQRDGRCLQFCAPENFALVQGSGYACWCDDGRKLQLGENQP